MLSQVSLNIRRINLVLKNKYICFSTNVKKVDFLNRQDDTPSADKILFAHAKHGPFYQESPKLHNPFSEDRLLQRFLKRNFPPQVYSEVSIDLQRFGNRIVSEIYDIGIECDKQLPHLIAYDAWGQRVDSLWTCDAWKQQRKISAEEGIVAIGYERKFHEWSRLFQFAKLYLYSPVAGLYTCPLAMTDGAAKSIEVINSCNPLFTEAYRRLTSRNPDMFWTSGQWMTERKGGSDVALGTETMAISANEGYRLYGYKWFTSATDADIALTLARIMDSKGNIIEGTKGLTLFYVKTKNERGQLNNIHLVKLKNKLGTRQVPTAELLLDGCVASKLSADGEGVVGISNMLTMTRIHNAAASVGVMRHVLRLARDYSQRRTVFGNKIGNYPLHMQTLARMELEVRGSLLLLFKVAILLGKIECKTAQDEDTLLLRLMTPILKLYTAKQAVSVVSEGLESFGGQGYIEDTGLPVMLRDAQVLPIWEGTTNILSLDVLRCIAKTNGDVLRAFKHSIMTFLEVPNRNKHLKGCCTKVEGSVESIIKFAENNPEQLMTAARDFAYSIARTYIGALLLENSCHPDSVNEDVIAAVRWCDSQDLCPLTFGKTFSSYDEKGVNDDYQLVMEGYEK